MSRRYTSDLESPTWGDVTWSASCLIKFFAVVILLSLVLGAIGWALEWVTLPARVVNPETGLYNWQWYYDTHASLQAQVDTIRQYQTRLDNFSETYGDPKTWDWQTKEEHQRLASIVDGYVANYNRVASEYNAAIRDVTRRWSKPPDLPGCIPNWGAEHCTYASKYEVH